MSEEQKRKIEEQIQHLLDNNIVLDAESKEDIDVSHSNINDFLEKHKGAEPTTDQDALNKLYQEYVNLMHIAFTTMKETKYKLTLTSDEFKFVKDVVLKKSKYGRTDVYLGLRVKNEFFELVSYPNGQESHTFMVDIDTVTLISYIVGKFEVEGLHKDALTFISVNEKFANISRIFDMFNKKSEALSEKVQNWFQGLDKEEVIVTESENTSVE